MIVAFLATACRRLTSWTRCSWYCVPSGNNSPSCIRTTMPPSSSPTGGCHLQVRRRVVPHACDSCAARHRHFSSPSMTRVVRRCSVHGRCVGACHGECHHSHHHVLLLLADLLWRVSQVCWICGCHDWLHAAHTCRLHAYTPCGHQAAHDSVCVRARVRVSASYAGGAAT